MRIVALTLLTLSLLAGCALPVPSVSPSMGGGQQPQQLQSATSVQLSRANYEIVRNNVVGSDWGISFLGLIPIVSPDYQKALAKLYKEGQVTEGRSQALVNVLQQHTAPFFILFSIPRITFRADVVEFKPPLP